MACTCSLFSECSKQASEKTSLPLRHEAPSKKRIVILTGRMQRPLNLTLCRGREKRRTVAATPGGLRWLAGMTSELFNEPKIHHPNC
jgi:hypothetical protein